MTKTALEILSHQYPPAKETDANLIIRYVGDAAHQAERYYQSALQQMMPDGVIKVIVIRALTIVLLTCFAALRHRRYPFAVVPTSLRKITVDINRPMLRG